MTRMWIGGKRATSANRQTFAGDNPATERIIDRVPRADERDADPAGAAAAPAVPHPRGGPRPGPATPMRPLAAPPRARQLEIARQMTLEGGKPFIENLDEVEWCAAVFDYYGEIARDQAGKVLAPVFPHQVNFVRKEPYGVVVCIVPWNYPLLLLSWKVAPALMAGNTVIIKPSENTPLSTLRMAEVAFSELPPGVVNVVTGYGREAGEALVTHPFTSLVAFTGSVATGRRIATLACERLKKIHLEL